MTTFLPINVAKEKDNLNPCERVVLGKTKDS